MRARHGDEVTLPSWKAALSEDLLGKWALNLMLINVSTRKFGRAVRLPEGDVPAPKGAGVSKVGGIAPVRGVVGGAHETMDGGRPVQSGPADHPD